MYKFMSDMASAKFALKLNKEIKNFKTLNLILIGKISSKISKIRGSESQSSIWTHFKCERKTIIYFFKTMEIPLSMNTEEGNTSEQCG